MSRQLDRARARWAASRRAKRTEQRPQRIAMGTVSTGAMLGGIVAFMIGVALFGGWAGKVTREEEERRSR